MNSLVLPVLLRPILLNVEYYGDSRRKSKLIVCQLQLEKRDVVASQTLRAALQKAEMTNPGLSFELVKGIISMLTRFIFFLSQHLIPSSPPKRQQIKGTSMLTCTRAFCGYKAPSRLSPTPQTVSIADGLWEKWSSTHSLMIHSSHGELFLDAKSNADRKQREVLSN